MSDSHDPWHWLEACRDDLRVRVARTRADADAVRSTIADGWPILDAEQLFERIIVPSCTTRQLRGLDAICMVIESIEHGEPTCVGTFSFVFDHHARTVEVGRGVIQPGPRRREIAELARGPIRRVLALLPTYAATTDVTTLGRGAARLVEAIGLHAVALHPSNASVASEAIGGWRDRLTRRRGAALGDLLIRESAATGLGRFMTCHHVRRPAALAPYQPALTAAQWPFYAHTCRAMELEPDAAATPQRARLRSTTLRDRVHTATRTIVDPPRALDVLGCVAASAREGFETLVIQVACDPQHQAVSERLEQAGAILGGVIVDARGYWRASYTVPTRPDHAAQVREDLARLAQARAFEGSTATLLRLVNQGGVGMSLERAC